MYLVKLYLTNIHIAVLDIQKSTPIYYNRLIISDCYGRIYKNLEKNIPQKFNNNLVFISANSFQQNHIILGKLLRKYIFEIIIKNKISEILCIGGESYLYGLTYDKIKIIYHYTNNIHIYNDCNNNNKFYKKNIVNNLIDYNDKNLNLIYNPNIKFCLLNLSNLSINLLKKINNNKYDNIIIISCHHEDFWKKIKLLTNYKIKKREHFICEKLKYFLTVNIFIKNN